MTRSLSRRFSSLRTQLTVGTTLLLIVTIAAVASMLIVHQRNVLTTEIEGKAVLQARNIALTSVKFLLRPDPEFDLFPMIQRLTAGTTPVTDVVVVDSDGTVCGHRELLKISTQYKPPLNRYQPSTNASLLPEEGFYENESEYLVAAPVWSQDRIVGTVYLTYSKADLHANLRKAFLITVVVSAGVLLIGIVLSFVFFRHISRPMNILLHGVERMDGDTSRVRIEMPSRNEFAILADAFNAMSERIDDARRTQAARDRMQHELELAREIQHSLLPGSVSSPRGYDIDHYYQAAYEVGGDYVDVIPLDDERLAIAMGDVSGKGVQGLVVMAMVKTLFQQLAPRAEDTQSIICDINAALYGSIKANMFVTFLAGIFDARSGLITLSNAGHNPMMVYRAEDDTIEQVRMGGPPLGAFGAIHFNERVEAREVLLNPGDVALIYTDGVNESRNHNGEMYTIPRVAETLRAHAAGRARDIVGGIVDDAEAFRQGTPQGDDLTLLVVRAPSLIPADATETSESRA